VIVVHFLSAMLRQPPRPCRLINATHGFVIATVLEGAFDSRTRKFGLLGRDVIQEEAAMVIAPSSAIHTCAMRFQIDVLFVNRQGEILKQVTALKPWRMAARPGAFAVIEFCAHHPGVARCAPGDRLAIEASDMAAKGYLRRRESPFPCTSGQ
jgi:uncharacterized membrane protein (UPF0127 family)